MIWLLIVPVSIALALLVGGPPPNRYSWRHKVAPWYAQGADRG